MRANLEPRLYKDKGKEKAQELANLQSQIEVAERYLKASKQLQNRYNEKAIEEQFISKMRKANIAENTITAFIKGMRGSPNYTKTGKMFNARVKHAEGLLGALQVLKTSHGKWTYSASDENIEFQNDGDVSAFNKYYHQIDAAEKEVHGIVGK